MKILAIRGKNIASLEGEFSIDFTTEPLRSAGIFSINGPTGSGKSTLLDVVCLALFAQTPRSQQAREQKIAVQDMGKALAQSDARNLLRRGTASGYAEVDFIAADGHSYRSRWSVRRARDRENGVLQDYEMQLTDLSTGNPVPGKKSELMACIVQRTGLTFEQFTRTVLLAQNEFSTFLKAEQNEKAELLEKLTGTEYFSLLSKKIYEKYAAAKSALDQVNLLTKGIELLSEEEVASLQKEVEEQERVLSVLREQEKHLSLLQERWLNLEKSEKEFRAQNERLQRLREEAVSLKSQYEERKKKLQTLKEREEAYIFEQERLNGLLKEVRSIDLLTGEKAKKLAELNEEELSTGRKQRDAESRKNEVSVQLASNKKQKEDTAAWIAAHQSRAHVAEQGELLNNLLGQIGDNRREHASLNELHKECVLKVKELTRLTEQKKAVFEEQKGKADEATQALRKLTEEREKIDFQSVSSQLQQWEKKLERVTALQKIRTESERTMEEFRKISTALQEAENKYDVLLPETKQKKQETEQAKLYKEGQEALYQNYLVAASEKIESLRPTLQDGVACPLCGATEHPYAHGERGAVHQLLASAKEGLKESQKRYEFLLGQYNQSLQSEVLLRKRMDELKEEAEKAEKAVKENEELWLNATDETFRLSMKERGAAWLSEEIETYNGQIRSLNDIRSYYLSLTQKAEQQQRVAEELKELCLKTEKEIVQDQQELSLTEQRQREYARRAEEKESAIATDKTKVDALFGNGEWQKGWEEDPALFLDRLNRFTKEWHEYNALIPELEKGDERLHAELVFCDQTLQECLLRQNSLQQKKGEIVRELSSLQERRSALFGTSDPDEKEVQFKQERDMLQKDIRREQEENEKISVAYERICGEEKQLSRSQEERDDELTKLRLQLQEEGDYEALPKQIEQLTIRQKELTEAISQIRMRLHSNTEKGERLQALSEEKKAKKALFESWGKLNELAGSSDGKKFRLIAQGYTLEILLADANRHLKELAPRYRLERIPETLALQVIDHDMCDESRTVHSLSGGESFLVSLALALGLSSLSSNRMRVESLFIDEGFGSLDGETLRIAMEALENLRMQGRKIGVISHVAEMAERITTQIRVEKASNGRSRIRVTG
ncbi:MAG: SbcC/MukB-like Walker B domain-containing protein [Bacteroidales bacterium]|nr:SbcC/MukB-like Walker B domain-containing protein [Bacteroidales bacterium]